LLYNQQRKTEEIDLSEIYRFGVSIESELLETFDNSIAERGYTTRSEALRDLIRDDLVRRRLETEPNVVALGSLTLVYDHHATNLQQEMTTIQHNFQNLVVSVLHVHINHNDCLEVLALRGAAGDIKKLADSLLSLKGVKHGNLFITLPTEEIHNH